MGNIEKVNSTKSLDGEAAREILRTWRKQRFIGKSFSACHQPPYAIRFYSKGKTVLFATICWACSNVTFIVPDVKYWVEFPADSEEARLLREVFIKAFPSEQRFISRWLPKKALQLTAR